MMKLKISFLLVLFWMNGLASQNGYFSVVNEYSNDTINNTGGANSPLVNYQKLNKVNSSNVALSVGLGIGL